MDIYIYSDESGVFDKKHNSLFVFGGVMFFSKEEKDRVGRKYVHAENVLRASSEEIAREEEVKACRIPNKAKSKLYRSLNQAEKFGIVIRQKMLFDKQFTDKKTKQRYLDWAFKLAVKRKFEHLITQGIINPAEVEHLHFFVDEHTTATNGRYELQQSLEQEFKIGTYNWEKMSYHPPIFTNLKGVSVQYCNSASIILVRAADIVANKLFFMAHNNREDELKSNKFNIIYHP